MNYPGFLAAIQVASFKQHEKFEVELAAMLEGEYHFHHLPAHPHQLPVQHLNRPLSPSGGELLKLFNAIFRVDRIHSGFLERMTNSRFLESFVSHLGGVMTESRNGIRIFQIELLNCFLKCHVVPVFIGLR